MRTLLALLYVTATLALASAHAATRNPWDGTWKIDTSQGNLVGDTFTYTALGKGKWQVSNGDSVQFQFAADGKPYRTTDPDSTVVVTRQGTRAWTFSRRSKGKEWDRMREELSDDGTTLTDQDFEHMDSGATNIVTTVYQRVGRGDGFAGKWKSVKLSGPHANWIFPWSYVFSFPAPDTVKWELPSDGITIEGKDDGSPIAVTPPGTTPVVTFTLRKDSDRQFSSSILVDGKPVKLGAFKLAADGKSFSQDSWNPAKPDEVRTAVFVKQTASLP